MAIVAQFKLVMKEFFSLWYSDQLAAQLKKGGELKKIDLKLTTLKPLHARWFLKAFDSVSNMKSVILAGWEETSIAASIEDDLNSVVSVNIDE